MITTGFNPYQARVANNVRPRQNEVAFQANFSKKMYNDLKDGEDYAYNDARVLIATGIIRAKDGALVQAEALLKSDPGNRWYQTLVDMLKNQK